MKYSKVNEETGTFIISSNGDSESLLQVPAEEFKQMVHNVATRTKSFLKQMKTIIVTCIILFLIVIVILTWCFHTSKLQFKNPFKKQVHLQAMEPNLDSALLPSQQSNNEQLQLTRNLSTVIQPTESKFQDDTVSLDTKNLIINYVKQTPSNK